MNPRSASRTSGILSSRSEPTALLSRVATTSPSASTAKTMSPLPSSSLAFSTLSFWLSRLRTAAFGVPIRPLELRSVCRTSGSTAIDARASNRRRASRRIQSSASIRSRRSCSSSWNSTSRLAADLFKNAPASAPPTAKARTKYQRRDNIGYFLRLMVSGSTFSVLPAGTVTRRAATCSEPRRIRNE